MTLAPILSACPSTTSCAAGRRGHAGQAVELGIAKQTVHRGRATEPGRLHPGVYLVGGHRLTDEVRVRAAGCGRRRAAVSGPAAAYWHGMLERAPAEIGLTVPRRCKPEPPVSATDATSSAST